MATNRYVTKLRSDFDWPSIGAEATANAEPDPDDEGQRVGRSYLGTVMSLAPSGKYYMPWACGNLDPCPRCRGTGHTKNPVACGWCGGSGHRSIAALALARGEPVEATMRFLEETSTTVNEATMTFPCFVCNGTGTGPVDCNWCGGLGSREAYLDQCWHEALDEVAGEHGMSIENGEGDPCDIFATISVDAEQGDGEPGGDECPPHAPAEPREPWQMARREYVDLLLDGKIAPPVGVVAGDQRVGRLADPHYTEVARAAAAGKPIPAEVLAEYPGIEQEAGQMGQAV